MAEPEPRPDDEESSTSTVESDGDESEVTDPHECHETVDPETREDVLDDYSHRCQACGRRGPEKGGLATLHVHHIERDPDGMDEHDKENLTVLCRPCHSWLHQQSTPDDSPVEITDADQSVLLPQDIEILRVLADAGPARTGDIAAKLTADLSVSSVRERLWVLMGLDNLVESRDRQIVDKDVETGEWGLTEQVETSARGHIPDDPQLLLQRMEDEQVRQALERNSDRTAITDVLGISRRTTFNKHKRACAYDFPLDVFNRGGRPSEEESDGQQPETTAAQQSDAADTQHQRDDADDDLEPMETWGTSETRPAAATGPDQAGEADTSRETPPRDVHREVQTAIDALEDLAESL
ncbi:HNH endonuclease [Natrinema sp. H-ect1]|uniref:HNH endonuclease n=1 Tax=Natrinema sp. H-ect1 TaxID=3242700 RepID=UPI00359D401A